MTPREFYQLTPAEFLPWIDAKIVAQKNQMVKENFRAGAICAAITNIYRDRKAYPNPFMPWDFLNCGDLAPEQPEEDPDECPADRIVRKMRMRITEK